MALRYHVILAPSWHVAGWPMASSAEALAESGNGLGEGTGSGVRLIRDLRFENDRTPWPRTDPLSASGTKITIHIADRR